MNELFEQRHTHFSPDRQYRYWLSQIWNPDLSPLNFLMLNPSTADETQNDPTVERCERRARATKDCGGVIITNLFALRSTDPSKLYKHPSPIGTENDYYILQAAHEASTTICAWGTHGKLYNRGKEVYKLLTSNNITTFCLKTTQDNHPCHPLYISYCTTPKIYTGYKGNSPLICI